MYRRYHVTKYRRYHVTCSRIILEKSFLCGFLPTILNFSTNANKADYCENLLSGFLQLISDLIKTLVAGVTNFKVLYACCTTACATTANTKTRITDLKGVTASDGVHFVAAGYRNLATRSQGCIRALLSAPPRPVKPSSHFWRGFKSPFGSKCAPTAPILSVRGKGGAGFLGTEASIHIARTNITIVG